MNHHLRSTESAFSPSFSCYATNGLAETAARVTGEIAGEDDCELDCHGFSRCSGINKGKDDFKCGIETVDDEHANDFEFNLSDDFSVKDQIRTVYPVFDRNLLRDLDSTPSDEKSTVKIELRKLFLEDRESQSSSSSETDELERLPPETYCMWTPRSSSRRCKKSNSTGSAAVTAAAPARMWRWRNLLRRSKSDGKEGLMMATVKKEKEKVAREVYARSKEVEKKEKVAREMYPRGKEVEKEKKRRSYLPYRQDLVGLFSGYQTLRF